jgi:hypothetical protein
MNRRRESPAAAQHEQVEKWPLRESNVMTSVPIATFVSCCGTSFYECRNQKDTGKTMILVPLSISRPAKISRSPGLFASDISPCAEGHD